MGDGLLVAHSSCVGYDVAGETRESLPITRGKARMGVGAHIHASSQKFTVS